MFNSNLANDTPHFTSIIKEPDGTLRLNVLGIINSTYEEQYELIKLVNTMLQMPTAFHDDLFTTFLKLMDSKNETIKYESLKTVFIIANNSTESALILVQKGVILPLLNHLQFGDRNLNSLHILYIILQNDFLEIDEATKSNIISALINFLECKPADELILQSIHVMASMFNNHNNPLPLNSVKKVMPYLLAFLKNPNFEIASGNAYCILLLTLDDNVKHHLTFDDSVFVELLRLLKIKNELTQQRILTLFSSLIGENDKKIGILFDNGILETMKEMLLENPSLENIMASVIFFQKNFFGSQKFIEEIINSDTFSLLISYSESDDIRVQKYISGMFFVGAFKGNAKHVLLFRQAKLFPALCNLLIKAEKSYDKIVLGNVLATFWSITSKTENYKCQIFQDFEECGAIDVVIRLEADEDDKIQSFAKGIMSFYDQHGNTCSKRY
uniref:26S proteasome non-ATPase regulatory subunit 5 n=1 Tax=Panagrolaimus davidi TaxID=227884 RepID=A0A914QVI1_9BILA